MENLEPKIEVNKKPDIVEGGLGVSSDVKNTRKRLTKKEESELQDTLFRNEMDRVSSLKRFVSSVLEEADTNHTTAVYFEQPNGFRVELFKGYVQSTMDNKKLLPADKSFDLDEYTKIAETLRKNKEINVENVTEYGVFGDVPMFSKDKYISPYLGINPDDSKIQQEKLLNYFKNKDNRIEEEKTKISILKEKIMSFFNQEK